VLLPGCTSTGWREGVGFMIGMWGPEGICASRGALRASASDEREELDGYSKRGTQFLIRVPCHMLGICKFARHQMEYMAISG